MAALYGPSSTYESLIVAPDYIENDSSRFTFDPTNNRLMQEEQRPLPHERGSIRSQDLRALLSRILCYKCGRYGPVHTNCCGKDCNDQRSSPPNNERMSNQQIWKKKIMHLFGRINAQVRRTVKRKTIMPGKMILLVSCLEYLIQHILQKVLLGLQTLDVRRN